MLFQVLNNPEQRGRFNITTQFPHYEEIVLKPDSDMRSTGKPVVFDMDMSAGDFLSLLYLLKVPREIIDLKVGIATVHHSLTNQTQETIDNCWSPFTLYDL